MPMIRKSGYGASTKLIAMKKYIRLRKNSLLVAWSGLLDFFKSEAHAAIHLTAAIVVLIVAWITSVNSMEWIALIFAIGLVVIAEIFNTVMEKVTDYMQPEMDPRIKVIKDMSAGAVLFSALVAIIIGGIVFIPYLF